MLGCLLDREEGSRTACALWQLPKAMDLWAESVRREWRLSTLRLRAEGVCRKGYEAVERTIRGMSVCLSYIASYFMVHVSKRILRRAQYTAFCFLEASVTSYTW